jgi:hypothetical protein
MTQKIARHTTSCYFSDIFGTSASKLERYGAFNISLLTDLPLFIDPFLLFHSRRKVYRALHNHIIEYLRFLRDKSTSDAVTPGLLRSWYFFSEVQQNWLGFSASGNKGRGLGREFADALNRNLHDIFSDFGEERITKGSHLEKLCLIKEGVGRDTISDFTTNLIKGYLLRYTEQFAQTHLKRGQKRRFRVPRARFNFKTQSWEERSYTLPAYQSGYVLLTPKDILTKDDTWINKHDLISDFESIPDAIPDDQLRAQVDNYFRSILPKRPKERDEARAKAKVYLRFPQLIDYFIKFKEEHGQQAARRSKSLVDDSKLLYVDQFGSLISLLANQTRFYETGNTTAEEVRQRLTFLKDVIENKGGHRVFYLKGKPVSNENDLHILYRLTWFGSRSTVTGEANDGRGPVDFKVSRSSQDITIVEMKLASNSQLKRNLQRQTQIYQKASDAQTVFKVVFYFSAQEEKKVNKILKELKLHDDSRVITIDARKDNKPSGSKA